MIFIQTSTSEGFCVYYELTEVTANQILEEIVVLLYIHFSQRLLNGPEKNLTSSGTSDTSMSIFPSVCFSPTAGLAGHGDHCQPSIRDDDMKAEAFDTLVCL